MDETFLTITHQSSDKKFTIQIASDPHIDTLCGHLDGVLRMLGYHYDGYLAIKSYKGDK